MGDPDGLLDLELVVVTVTLAYVAAAHKRTGGTAGESLLAVTYRHVRRAVPATGSEP